jgi:hypothetical protein
MKGESMKASKQFPKNPRPPVPEFVTADFERFTAYGWKCLKYGVQSWGDTKAEAITLWFEAYRSEYGISA